jgi:hypothetical protein
MSINYEIDGGQLAEQERRHQREDVDTWDLATVAKVFYDLGQAYPNEPIWTRLEALPLAVSGCEFGDTFLKDGFVPYNPFFTAKHWPPLKNPNLFTRTYSACQHVLAVLYDPFRSEKHAFPPAWGMHFALWNDTSDVCPRCVQEQAAGLPRA